MTIATNVTDYESLNRTRCALQIKIKLTLGQVSKISNRTGSPSTIISCLYRFSKELKTNYVTCIVSHIAFLLSHHSDDHIHQCIALLGISQSELDR